MTLTFLEIPGQSILVFQSVIFNDLVVQVMPCRYPAGPARLMVPRMLILYHSNHTFTFFVINHHVFNYYWLMADVKPRLFHQQCRLEKSCSLSWLDVWCISHIRLYLLCAYFICSNYKCIEFQHNVILDIYSQISPWWCIRGMFHLLPRHLITNAMS